MFLTLTSFQHWVHVFFCRSSCGHQKEPTTHDSPECVCVCAWERERLCVCTRERVCVHSFVRERVCVCMWERECACVQIGKRDALWVQLPDEEEKWQQRPLSAPSLQWDTLTFGGGNRDDVITLRLWLIGYSSAFNMSKLIMKLLGPSAQQHPLSLDTERRGGQMGSHSYATSSSGTPTPPSSPSPTRVRQHTEEIEPWWTTWCQNKNFQLSKTKNVMWAIGCSRWKPCSHEHQREGGGQLQVAWGPGLIPPSSLKLFFLHTLITNSSIFYRWTTQNHLCCHIPTFRIRSLV